MSEKLRELIETVEELNPLDNQVEIDSTTKVKWNISPDFDLDESKFEIEWSKDFNQSDIEITVKVNGKAKVFTSGPGYSNLRVFAALTKRLR